MFQIKKLTDGNFTELCWDGRNGYIAAFDKKIQKIRVIDPVLGRDIYSFRALPHAMCFDIYGRLIVCDENEETIVRNDHYAPAVFGRDADGKKVKPIDVLVHSCGAYFVLGIDSLYYVIPEGRAIFDACPQRKTEGKSFCLAKDEAGILYIRSTDGRIIFAEFTPEGKFGIERTVVYDCEFGDAFPEKIVTDESGKIYCSADDKLFIFNQFGRKLETVQIGEIRGVTCMNEDGAVLIALPDGIYRVEVKC